MSIETFVPSIFGAHTRHQPLSSQHVRMLVRRQSAHKKNPRETNNAPCHFLILLPLGREGFKGVIRIRRAVRRSCHRCHRQKRVLAPGPSKASTRLYILKATPLAEDDNESYDPYLKPLMKERRIRLRNRLKNLSFRTTPVKEPVTPDTTAYETISESPTSMKVTKAPKERFGTLQATVFLGDSCPVIASAKRRIDCHSRGRRRKESIAGEEGTRLLEPRWRTNSSTETVSYICAQLKHCFIWVMRTCVVK